MSEPKGRGAAWTEEIGTSDEGRRRLKAPRRRAGYGAHLDTDVLAEFRAGLITGRRGAKIAAHLAGCDHCAALDDRLTGVSALLASVPAPVMPDSVAQRLDTVLAAEAAKRNYPERTAADRSPDRETHDRPAGHRGSRLLRLRVLAPVAVAVVLLAAGGYGLSLIGGGPARQAASSSAGSGANSSSASSAAKSASRAYAPAAPISVAPTARPARMPVNLPFVTSHTNFLPATLKQQVETALRAPRGPTQPVSAPMRKCVQTVAGGASLVLVESARYKGQPATIIVARESNGYMAWVAGPGCSHVLATATLPSGIFGP
jgi:hypothetical protein